MLLLLLYICVPFLAPLVMGSLREIAYEQLVGSLRQGFLSSLPIVRSFSLSNTLHYMLQGRLEEHKNIPYFAVFSVKLHCIPQVDICSRILDRLQRSSA